jgi:hypothetical protein
MGWVWNARRGGRSEQTMNECMRKELLPSLYTQLCAPMYRHHAQDEGKDVHMLLHKVGGLFPCAASLVVLASAAEEEAAAPSHHHTHTPVPTPKVPSYRRYRHLVQPSLLPETPALMWPPEPTHWPSSFHHQQHHPHSRCPLPTSHTQTRARPHATPATPWGTASGT